MIRQILTFHLAVILLLSNVGIPVFKHICHSQGKTWSSVVIPTKSCCSKKKLTGIDPCHSSRDETGISSRPCCENQQDILQLSVDYLQSHFALTKCSPTIDIVGTFVFNQNFKLITNSDLIRFPKAHGPPGNLYGRSLLISQQVFRC
jgi:hypothetical protein